MKPILIFVTLLFSLSCSQPEKPAAAPPMKHYNVDGKIVSVNPKEQTALIDAKEIVGYMAAMKMDYPIQSKDEFQTLHAGDHITGTLDVSADGNYTLSHIKIAPESTPSK